MRRIDNAAKLLDLFLSWLLARRRQADMPGGGRAFRRKTARFWEIWPMPPKVEAPRRVVYVNGIHLGRKAVVLIASDDEHVLGWHLARTGNSRAWAAPMSRIAEPEVAVSDGEDGRPRLVHKRLVKARRSLVRLVNAGTLFTYLGPGLTADGPLPATSNSIEGGVNAQLRAMLGDHRGFSIERRLKAVFWWCYMHSPDPLPAAEILRAMPAGRSIAEIYGRMGERERLEGTIPRWGDAIVWSELHSSEPYRMDWD